MYRGVLRGYANSNQFLSSFAELVIQLHPPCTLSDKCSWLGDAYGNFTFKKYRNSCLVENRWLNNSKTLISDYLSWAGGLLSTLF